MSVFDRRHRWGDPVRKGVFIERTCRACGRTESHETFIPDAFLEKLIAFTAAPNPYRTLLK